MARVPGDVRGGGGSRTEEPTGDAEMGLFNWLRKQLLGVPPSPAAPSLPPALPGSGRPGLDVEQTRQWARRHPRIKDEERQLIFAALDLLERLREAPTVTGEELAALVEAARCRWG